MTSHELFCSGVRRTIGNVTTTMVWGDPLLPGNSPSVQTVMPLHLHGTTIAGLIDPTIQTWDLPLLHEIFLPYDIECISRLLVSSTYENSWYWHGDLKGFYSVSRGYRISMCEFKSAAARF